LTFSPAVAKSRQYRTLAETNFGTPVEMIGGVLQALIQAFTQSFQRGVQHVAVSAISKNASGYLALREELKKNPLKVFVSYDWDDRPKVLPLYERMKAQAGIEPFLDKMSEIKDIPLANRDAWEGPLQQHLRNAECVMICLSPESVKNRGYFNRHEVPYILKAAKQQREIPTYVIIVKLEDCKVPRKYKPWDVTDVYLEGGYEKMLDTITQAREQLKDARGLRFKLRKPI
jgi:ribosomal protein L39E